MRTILICILVALAADCVQGQTKHSAEIQRLKAECDSITAVQRQTVAAFKEQLDATLQRLQGRIDERNERIAWLKADTVAVKPK